MREVICNTSPLQYLHQLGHLNLLQRLATRIVVPRGVLQEIEEGARQGVDLPELARLPWVEIRTAPLPPPAVLAAKLGPGESDVLALGLSATEPILILDDGRARKVAGQLSLRVRGTLGVLVDAKNAGHVQEIKPLLTRLDALGFRLARETFDAVLELAGEASS